jgi:hypothetical protein
LIGVKIAEGVNAAMPLQEVLAELERGKGKQFDPQIVEIFLGEKIFNPPAYPNSYKNRRFLPGWRKYDTRILWPYQHSLPEPA